MKEQATAMGCMLLQLDVNSGCAITPPARGGMQMF